MDELDYFVENAFSLATSGYYRVEGQRNRARHSFADAVRKRGVIAEFKRMTPSTSYNRMDVDASAVLSSFMDAGAVGLSVLTEPHRFGGSIEDLKTACTLDIPVMMKDFIIDVEQVQAAHLAGADAVLLIAEIFDRYQYSMDVLIEEARSLSLEVVLEVNSTAQYLRSLETDADVIGINNRDLSTLTLHRNRTEEILSSAPKDRPVLAMSGMGSAEDVMSAMRAGADSVLVGTSIMRNEGLISELVEAARIARDKDMRQHE